MKKLLLSLSLVVSSTAMAQPPSTAGEKFKVSTNTFWSNWQAQAAIQMAAFYPATERGAALPASPLKSFRSNPQLSLALGKWFTPGIGLRTKLTGIWAKATGDSFTYWNLQQQALLNITNMVNGYNPERLWSIIPFLGLGYARNCTDNQYATATSLGVLNQFRLNDKLSLNIELGWNRMENAFSSQGKSKATYGWNSHDNGIYAEIGVTLSISKSRWDKTPDVNAIEALTQSQLDALDAQLRDAEAENERLRQMLEEKDNTIDSDKQ